MKLSDMPLILASGSPRRIEMLENEGLSPRVLKTGCGEDIHTELGPAQTVMALALRKGLEAERRLSEEGGAGPCLAVSADTIVCRDGKIYGKPESEEEAFSMLRDLRGKVHQVYTGVFLNFIGSGRKLLFYDRTDVFVGDFGEEWLKEYVESGEPMDKAGGYAIQGSFGRNIERIEGAYDNVVGLPLEKIKRVLASMAAAPQN
ncbi:MAG: septum formation protein Maf [Firmicutes bacterium]|nr:septum formation protein Maf [Bacillota bacterium]